MGDFNTGVVIRIISAVIGIWLVCFIYHYWHEQTVITDLMFQKNLAQQRYDSARAQVQGINDTHPNPKTDEAYQESGQLSTAHLDELDTLNSEIEEDQNNATNPLWFMQ